MKLARVLLTLLLLPVPTLGQSPVDEGKRPIIVPQPPVPEAGVLTEADKRELLLRLAELQMLREKVRLQEAYIAKDQAQDEREAALHAREMELAKQKQALTEQELGIWKDKAAHFEEAYDLVRKAGHRSVGCWVGKILTVNLLRCGG